MKQSYKVMLLLLCIAYRRHAVAQELFVFTEPASNMPAKSIGIRATNLLMNEQGPADYYFIPEIMWGVNKHLMLHAEGYFSNQDKNFKAVGLGLYAKYRLYSNDKLYHHFRIAAFGRLSSNNEVVQQEAIQTNGQNSGYQVGFIGTQLLHKTALSVTVYYERALNNWGGNEFPPNLSNRALNYSFSVGQLLFPKKYVGYRQTNVNLMIEALGQSLADNGKRYMDIAPAVQFIFNSQTRVDIGYRKELYSNMQRVSPEGFLLRIEHLLFNVI